MKTIILCFLFGADLFAQTLSMSVNPATGGPGSAAVLTISFADAAPSVNLAGVQWTLTLPAALGSGAGTLSGAAAATKVLTCNGLTCIAAGSGTPLNATPLASGALVTIPLTVSPAPALGAASIALSAVLGANATGIPVAMTASPVTFTVLPSKYDLNGDGVINNADVTLALSQADGVTACSSADVNGDGKCNVADVVLVILASLGIIH